MEEDFGANEADELFFEIEEARGGRVDGGGHVLIEVMVWGSGRGLCLDG